MRRSPARQYAERLRGNARTFRGSIQCGRSPGMNAQAYAFDWRRVLAAEAVSLQSLYRHFAFRTSRRFTFQVIRRRLWRKCVASVRKGTVQLRPLWGLTSLKVAIQAAILLPAKHPATNCNTSSDSSLIMQSLYDGRDVCSYVPQSDDPLSVASGQFWGHSYLQSSPRNTWTVFGRVTFQTELDYIRTYTLRKFLHACTTRTTWLSTFNHYCMYVHAYTHTYIRTYIHNEYIHTYIHIRTYIHTYIHTYIPTYMNTYIHTYIHEYIHTYLHTWIHTYIHTTWIHTCTY